MSTDKHIYYFDHNATTPVAPEVLEVMLPYLSTAWGNPSSAYRFASHIADEIEGARESVAQLINADPRQIIFTSCGTESNNAAFHSALCANPHKRHVITSAVEHSANIQYCKYLQRRGFEVTLIPVDSDGLLDLFLLDQSIRPDTALVSIMWANNETGILCPIEEIAALCRAKGVPFHTDGVQAAGKIPIDVQKIPIDFLSLSAHKLRAPKGIGALYLRNRSSFQPYVIGGHQERGKRGGTENVAGIIAFGKAAEMALQHLPEENTRVRQLRDGVEAKLLREIPGSRRNRAKEPRLPNTINLAFSQVEAEAVLLKLDQARICASSGSACTTGSIEPSHVLTAMNVRRDLAKSSLRFSFGIENTAEEILYLEQSLPPIIHSLREAGTPLHSLSPSEEIADKTNPVSA